MKHHQLSKNLSCHLLTGWVFCFALLFSSFNTTAQTVNLGPPQSWLELLPETVNTYVTPEFDMEQIKAEDAINDQDKSGPWRFGYEHNVAINVLETATIDDIPGHGKIYRLGLYSKGALTINLIFDRFHLPEGATLHLYSTDHEYVIGAYTSGNNRPEKVLGTELVHGSNIVVEYFEPAKVSGQGELVIGMVVHGYRSLDVYADGLLKSLNDSGDCNHDVLCPTGDEWEDQISSVGLILTGGGTCSGALVNNTSEDKTPYFLTARHCGLSTAFWAIRFNWESTVARCASTENSIDPGPPYDQTANGATLNASNSGSDFTLVTLDNLTPLLANQWDVYFAGWDRSDDAPSQTTGIHHPRGDVKKICRDNNAATKNTINFEGDANAMMWRIENWDVGVTEPGSSGSPLFDQNKRIIGQLCCGAAACDGTDDNDLHDNYGRFGVSWDGADASERLKDWLDPGNTDAATLNGRGPDVTDPSISCPGNMMMDSDPGLCNKTFTISGPTSVSDDCDPSPALDFRYRTNDGLGNTGSWSGWKTNTTQTLDVDRWEIEWRATDESGNDNTCSYFIEIQDNEDPDIVCPTDVVQSADENCQSILPDLTGDASVSDNCSAPGDIKVTQSPAPGTVINLGATAVTLTAEDQAGNTAMCTEDVTVVDDTPPIVTASLIPEPGNGNSCVTRDFSVSCSATDNCDDNPSVSSVIETPQFVNPTVNFIVGNKKKLVFKPNNNKVTVGAPDPQTFWADVQADGGVSVEEGQTIKITQIPANNGGGNQNHIFTFNNDGSLKKVTAPIISLRCDATDFSGNTASASTNPDFQPCNGSNLTLPDNESEVIFGQELLSQLSLFPNPATEQIHWNLHLVKEVEKMHLQVIDIRGAILHQEFIGIQKGDNLGKLDISQLPVGMYWLRFTGDDTPLMKRFIKVE